MKNSFSVLVVDDNRELVETFKDIFEFKDFEVATARGGAEALSLFQQRGFDAVVLDLVMPGMTGAETMRAIRKLDAAAQFIIVTGYADSVQIDEVNRQGTLGVFPKPLVVEDVVQLLSRLRDEKPDRTGF